jgi:hypothetical protein
MMKLQKFSDAQNKWIDKGQFMSAGDAMDYASDYGREFPYDYRVIDSKGRIVQTTRPDKP